MVDLSKPIFDRYLVYSPSRKLALGRLLEDLLLVDSVIVNSYGLLEVAEVARILGDEDALTLLRDGSIKFRCTGPVIATSTQNHIPPIPGRALPSGAVSWGLAIDANEGETRTRLLDDIGTPLSEIRLSTSSIRKLRGTASELLTKPVGNDYRQFVIDAVAADLYRDSQQFPLALSLAIESRLRTKVDPKSIQVRAERADDHSFIPVTNLSSLSIEPSLHLELASSAIRHVGERVDAQATMWHFDCIASRSSNQLPLFDSRTEFLFKALAPDGARDALSSVLRVTGVPSIEHALQDGSFKLKKFLEIRRSDECTLFRREIAAGKMTEERAREILASLRAKLHVALTSPRARLIRFFIPPAVTVGTSLLFPDILGAGAVVGAAARKLDSMIVERYLKGSGAEVFIRDLLPSAFEKSD